MQRSGTSRSDNQRDQDVFARPLQPLRKRQAIRLHDHLKSVTRHDPSALTGLFLRTGGHVAEDHFNVVKIRPRSEETSEFRQRYLDAPMHFASRGDRRSAKRYWRRLLRPVMQLRETLAGR